MNCGENAPRFSIQLLPAFCNNIKKHFGQSKVTQGPLFLELISKNKLGDELTQLKKNLKNCGINDLNSVTISRVLKVLALKNIFQSLYNEIFNIQRFLE